MIINRVSAIVILFITLPLWFVIYLLIKLNSPGPFLFKQKRLGKNKKSFYIYKFRTMIKEAENLRSKVYYLNEADRPVFKIRNDPRYTKIGRFLREAGIDELPQFFNVLACSMSIVGPRPHQPREVALYEKHHKKVLTLKPGITGLAQTSGRSDLSFEDEVRLDVLYIERWTWFLDLIIFIKTPFIVFKKRKAL